MSRGCAACDEYLPREEFSRNQWLKGAGISRCKLCVAEGVGINEGGFGTARTCEGTTRVDFDWSEDEEGSFRYCCYGTFRGGPRTGQQAVAKWFKPEYYYMEDSFFQTDENAVDRAILLISQFNNAGITDKIIRLNKGEIWSGGPNGTQFLVEPYIENFEKFNSNTGWVHRRVRHSDTIQILQALSHFTYHISSGQFTLCDLQGGIYRNGVVLTDPVVCSRNRRFGPPDLGMEGFSTFFARHRCNSYCQKHWSRPKDTNLYYPASRGTTMESSVGAGYTQTRYQPTMTVYDESDGDY